MPDSKNIDKAKQKAINYLNSHIDEMGAAAYAILLQTIEDTFDFKEGKIVADKSFIRSLNKLTINVLDLLQTEPKFTGPVSEFVKRMTPISEAISTFQKGLNDIKIPEFATAKKIVVDEIIDKMLNNGLNQKFVQPLRNLIYQNVSSGLSIKEAKSQIKDYIEGGHDQSGKLSSYLEQTAEQATDAYSGAINFKILEQFNMDGLLITGSLIDNSSPQCRFAINELKGKITRDNWEQVKAIAEKQSGWIEGTTFDNLPINRLHWGCRHSFYPIIIKKAA